LSEAAKAELSASYLPHEIEARTLGIPSLGRGAVYPLAQGDYTCDPFPLPAYFPRSFGLDVGWNWTSAVWLAVDLENDVDYFYREYERSEAPPDIHVAAIRSSGDWVPGVVDPSAKQRSQVDGRNLFAEYVRLGLKLTVADNAVEAGILHLYQRLASGRTKVFRTCTKLLEDMRFYHRDENGRVVKERDHLPDACRYVSLSGRSIAKCKPIAPVTHTTGKANGQWHWG